ncbi:MAG: DNA polymerase III subunit beta [Ardenticatenaceae bacterium]|nr:DNA polymerase III subunit beta [Ardenticatenaceae bacterium]
MKVTCLQENLAKGLSIVGRAVSPRSTLPVLANVLIATDNGRLKLSATNLEIVITCWLGAKVEEEGALTVPARTLTDLVNNLPPEQINLTLDQKSQTLHLDCMRTESNIKGIDADEFPLVPEPSQENRIKMSTPVLKEMINQVAFAAAADDTRPTLTGIKAYFEGDTVTMAATDGFRLSVRQSPLLGTMDNSLNVIIPARALNEVARVANDEMEFVYISMPEKRNQIVFDMESVVVITQLIDGNFPDYSAVLPKRHATRTVLNTSEFMKACKRADIFAREASHTARVRIEPGDEITPGFTTITANSVETGDNVAQLDANVIGDPVEIAFNVKYMIDVLNVINSPQVALETTTPMEPGVLKPVGAGEFTHVIMPMHFGR